MAATTRRLPVLLAVVALATLVVACGSDEAALT